MAAVFGTVSKAPARKTPFMKNVSHGSGAAVLGPQAWVLTAVACALQAFPALAQTPTTAAGPGSAPVSQRVAVIDRPPLQPDIVPPAVGLATEATSLDSSAVLAATTHTSPAAPSVSPAKPARQAVPAVTPAVRIPSATPAAGAASAGTGAASPSAGAASSGTGTMGMAMHAAHMATALPPCSSVSVDPPTQVILGKSTVLRLATPIVRMVVGGAPAGRSLGGGTAASAGAAALASSSAAGDGVAQVDLMLLGPSEVFVLGRRPGSMNLILQAADGRCFLRDVMVTVDPEALQTKLAELLPGEGQIRVRAMDSALVLTGQVSDSLKADEVMSLAQSLGEGRRVVSLLRVSAPQQVMLEVKIAEVSKGVLDRLGIDLTRVARTGDGARIFTGLFGGNPLLLGKTASTNIGLSGRVDVGRGVGLDIGAGKDTISGSGGQQGASGTLIGIDAQAQDALVRVLAEPNIMALSGQAASFLSGGKIFIPVRQGNGAVALDERQFGVGLKFLPTVLEGGRINLKLTTEASELSQTGSALSTADGLQSVLPTVSTRQVDTTVQLGDGQSLAIAGLIRHTVSQSLNRFPGLGDLPILGALFRSTAFQKDQTELVFVITPRLVQPLRTAMLPTEVHVEPSRQDAIAGGKGEGQAPQQPGAPAARAVPALSIAPVSPTGRSAGDVPMSLSTEGQP